MDRIGYDYEVETGYDERKARALEEMNVPCSVKEGFIHAYLRRKQMKPEFFSVLGQDIKLQRPSLEEAYLKRVKDEDH